MLNGLSLESGDDLSSRAVTSQVLSALRSLTSVFGMGTGGTFSPLSPEIQVRGFPWLRFASGLPFPLLCFRSASVFSAFLLALSSGSLSYPQNLILECSSLSRDRFGLSTGLTFAFLRSSPRPISIGNLSHHCVYSANLSTLSSSRGLTDFCHGILVLEGGFTLRCFQRLSRPHFASLLCRWHDNSCTRGASTPVLSY